MIGHVLFALIALWFLNLMLVPPEGLRSLGRDRKYKSGTAFCVWRWTDVESEYILRLHVFKTPWFAVCLHWINKPDREPWLHDHPVTFSSLILRGGYAEKRWSKRRGEHIRLHSWFNFIRASRDDRHQIILVRRNTLTLAFMGPKTREWGFHMPAGWVGWKEYYARLKDGENMRRENQLEIIERTLSPTLDRMTALHSPGIRTHIEEAETREIDTAPADEFKAEPPTDPGHA